MKILHVISGIDAAAGGTATALLALAPAQVRAGLEVSVAATYQQLDSEAADLLRSQGVELTLIGPAKWPLARHPEIVPKLTELIAQADCVHVHGMWEEIQHQACRIARKRSVPYVMTPHGMLDPWSLSQSRLKKRIYLRLRMRKNLDRASAIHFTTPTECELVRPLKSAAQSLIEANGIDLSEFDPLPERGRFRAKFPQLEGKRIVIFLGRLHYKKGFDLLIPAFAKIEDPDAILVIAGPDQDGYRDEIQKLIDAHSLTSRVLFTGMLRGRQRIEALVDADLFVLSSYQENFGIAVIEALAAGCPVVISDQVNIWQTIRQQQVGGVVPTQVDPLAAELDRWLNDETLRRDAGERGQEFVRRAYDWNEIARRWVKHYESLQAR